MRKNHDLGGIPNEESINLANHELEEWERRVDALNTVLGEKGLKNTDQLRRAIESLSPEQYKLLSYYEKWTAAMEILLTEQGVMTSQEIDAKMVQLKAEVKNGT